MQRRAFMMLVLITCTVAASAGQRQVRGQVVNRDGAPQRCQLEFFSGPGTEPQYRAASDAQGYFFVNDPKIGAYRVVVAQGNRREEFKRVTIDQNRLNPSTLVVQTW